MCRILFEQRGRVMTSMEHAFYQRPLPTMYDLPSDNPEESGRPDEIHWHQANLLRDTFQPPGYSSDQFLTSSFLHYYYDSRNTSHYIRPDWAAVFGVPRKIGPNGRLNYVLWQEVRSPFIAVELLSPNPIEKDQGKKLYGQTPPMKWEVYESFLRVPYYVLFDWKSNDLQIFCLEGATYQEISKERLWIPELEIGLGLWQGTFSGFERQWLRWYDNIEGNWVSTLPFGTL
jgi:Uma2 family endonuclease